MEARRLDDSFDDANPQQTETAGGTGRAVGHRRFQHVRDYLRSLSFLGLVFGWAFMVVSLTPSLLPRSWVAQGFVSGSALAQGYGLGVLISWAGRRLRVPRPGKRVMRQAWYTLGLLALITIPLITVLSSRWEGPRVRLAVGVPAANLAQYLLEFLLAAGVAAGVIGLARLIHDAYLVVAKRLGRRMPVLAARLVALGLVATLAVGLGTGFADQVVMRVLNSSFAGTNDGNLPGVAQPASPLRSGSPSSLVPWDSLGMEGREFVASGPTARDIERFTGRPAVQPVRVYVGLDSAKSLQGEADLAVRELRRTGAFQRALLALTIPTGRGSVYPTLADPLEYMYGGNTAIASIQFSFLPSWIAFVTQGPQAAEAGRALFDTVYRYWATLPANHRPKLVVFGESLGAYAAEAPFSSVADLTSHVDGALFVGPPNETPLRRELTAARAAGSPERLPVYGDGRTVRFAASAADLRLPGGALRHPKVVYLQHASDPVVWWSSGLLWRKPDWLAEPRGPQVPSKMQWYPFVTFWQVSADLIVSSATLGYGHQYGPEVPTAWAAILHPPGWTNTDTAKLTVSEVTGKLP